MRDDGSATTAMLGLAGFVVLAVSEHDGEVEQAVETTADEGWCRGCGVPARLHDRRPELGAGSARGRSAGDAGVGQAGVALPRAAVSDADLDRDHRRRSGRGRR